MGAGGLGAPAAIYLAAAGIGKNSLYQIQYNENGALLIYYNQENLE